MTATSPPTRISFDARARRTLPGGGDQRQPAGPARINIYERWESWDAIEAWRAVANAPDTGRRMDDAEVKAYEVASERDPF